MALPDHIIRQIENAPKFDEEGIAAEILVKNYGERIEALAHAAQFRSRIVIRVSKPVVVDDRQEQRFVLKNSEVF